MLETWFHDEDAGLSATMAALDRELTRGGRIVARVQDLDRLASPLRAVVRAVFDARRSFEGRVRERAKRSDEGDEIEAA